MLLLRCVSWLTFKFPSNATEQSSPFLPKLSDISFAIEGNTHAVPLMQLVASRWYNTAACDVPSPVASLERISIVVEVPNIFNVEILPTQLKQSFSRVAEVAEVDFRIRRSGRLVNYGQILSRHMVI